MKSSLFSYLLSVNQTFYFLFFTFDLLTTLELLSETYALEMFISKNYLSTVTIGFSSSPSASTVLRVQFIGMSLILVYDLLKVVSPFRSTSSLTGNDVYEFSVLFAKKSPFIISSPAYRLIVCLFTFFFFALFKKTGKSELPSI